MMQKNCTESLLVIGAGQRDGMEFADFYASLGARVTVVRDGRPYPSPRGHRSLGKQPNLDSMKKRAFVFNSRHDASKKRKKKKINVVATIKTSSWGNLGRRRKF